MAMFDFGRKPSWIENPPEGTLVTTAQAPTDNPFLGFEKANMQAFTKFMEDRGYQTGAIRGLQPNREVWYDNETGTAYTLSDTSNATISGGKKLPPKKPATKADPTRPSAPIRERRASEDPLTDAISDDSDDAIDLAGLEPPTGTRQSAPQDRTVSRDSAMLGMPTQGTTAQQDDQLIERLVGESNRRGRAASRDAELQRRANLPPEEETIRRGTTRSGRVIQGSKPGLFESEYTQKRGRRRGGQYRSVESDDVADLSLSSFQPSAPLKIIGMDEAARTADRPRGLPTLQRDITDPDMSDDTVTADEEEVELDLEGMAPSPTLLQRIGNALKDNPELAASGAQLLGGLISNAAQNRAQRRADRTTDQRVARANLISAITGGRARPTVERAQADTGGFLSLDTLGKAFQGGGAAVKGELSRRVEEAERERKAGLDERAAELAEAQAESLDAYRKGTLSQRKKEFDAQQELLDKQLEQELEKASGKDIPPPKLQEKYKAAGQVIDQVDNLVNLMEDAGAFAKGFGLSTIRFLGFDSAPQFMESGQDTAEIKAAANALVQTLGQDMSGVLSDQDIRFIKEQSIDPEDNMEVALRKAALIRNRLIQSMTQNYNADSQNYNMTAFLPIVEKVVSGGNTGFEDTLAQDNISLGK